MTDAERCDRVCGTRGSADANQRGSSSPFADTRTPRSYLYLIARACLFTCREAGEKSLVKSRARLRNVEKARGQSDGAIRLGAVLPEVVLCSATQPRACAMAGEQAGPRGAGWQTVRARDGSCSERLQPAAWAREAWHGSARLSSLIADGSPSPLCGVSSGLQLLWLSL